MAPSTKPWKIQPPRSQLQIIPSVSPQNFCAPVENPFPIFSQGLHDVTAGASRVGLTEVSLGLVIANVPLERGEEEEEKEKTNVEGIFRRGDNAGARGVKLSLIARG